MVRARGKSLAAFAVVTLGGTFAAHADEPPPPAGAIAPEDVSRQPPPAPPPVPVHREEARPMVVAEAPSPLRPEGMSIGIGLGYDFPTGLDEPNLASVRFRLASGLTFEPFFRLDGSSDTSSMNVPGANPDDIVNGSFEIALGSNVRLPVKSKGKFDLDFIGAAALAFGSEDPNGDDNTRSTFAFTLAWGLAVDWWFTEHWNVSLTATNPLFQYASLAQDMGAGFSTTDTILNYGIIFSPNVTLMGHLYF
jgi:hypothetical protein